MLKRLIKRGWDYRLEFPKTPLLIFFLIYFVLAMCTAGMAISTGIVIPMLIMGEPRPGADVAGRAQSRRGCGRGEPAVAAGSCLGRLCGMVLISGADQVYCLGDAACVLQRHEFWDFLDPGTHRCTVRAQCVAMLRPESHSAAVYSSTRQY